MKGHSVPQKNWICTSPYSSHPQKAAPSLLWPQSELPLRSANQPLFSSPSSCHLPWSSVFCSPVSNPLTFPLQFPSRFLPLPTNLMQHSFCKGSSEESWLVSKSQETVAGGAVLTCSQLRGSVVEHCWPPASVWLEHTQAAIAPRWRGSGCLHDFPLSIACASADQWVKATCL